MGLVLGFGIIAAAGGAGLGIVCLEESRKLRQLGHQVPAGCFLAGAVACATVALGGAWMAWSIISGFIL